MIKCQNIDCVKNKNKICELEIVHIDLDGGCNDFVPIHRCGECAKFHTKKCHSKCCMIFEKDDAASHICFELKKEG